VSCLEAHSKNVAVARHCGLEEYVEAENATQSGRRS
jgi:hypothetical protein